MDVHCRWSEKCDQFEVRRCNATSHPRVMAGVVQKLPKTALYLKSPTRMCCSGAQCARVPRVQVCSTVPIYGPLMTDRSGRTATNQTTLHAVADEMQSHGPEI